MERSLPAAQPVSSTSLGALALPQPIAGGR